MTASDRPIAPRSPWQKGHVERLIGSVRRECLDHLVVSGEAHLRRTLKTYAAYYNEIRTHLALDKDAPNCLRSQTVGAIVAIPVLGGLHHQYVRIWAFDQRQEGSCVARDTPFWGYWKHHELPNFCPHHFAQLSYHARRALRPMRGRTTLVIAFWEQANLFPL